MNYYLFNIINQFAFRWLWLDAMAIFFASYFQYAAVIALAFFLVYNFRKYLPIVSLALFSAAFARAFLEIIYYIFPTQRPFQAFDVNRLVFHSPGDAFPSGHATFFFALAAIIFIYNKKAGLLYLLFAFLISLARVYCGIHWPLDILGGAIVGSMIALALNLIFSKIARRESC